MRIVETEQGQKVLVHYEEALDGLGTETAHVAVSERETGLYAIHSSFRRGGCLYAGTIVLRNFQTGACREIDVTSRASETPEHLRYLLGLAARHVG